MSSLPEFYPLIIQRIHEKSRCLIGKPPLAPIYMWAIYSHVSHNQRVPSDLPGDESSTCHFGVSFDLF